MRVLAAAMLFSPEKSQKRRGEGRQLALQQRKAAQMESDGRQHRSQNHPPLVLVRIMKNSSHQAARGKMQSRLSTPAKGPAAKYMCISIGPMAKRRNIPWSKFIRDVHRRFAHFVHK